MWRLGMMNYFCFHSFFKGAPLRNIFLFFVLVHVWLDTLGSLRSFQFPFSMILLLDFIAWYPGPRISTWMSRVAISSLWRDSRYCHLKYFRVHKVSFTENQIEIEFFWNVKDNVFNLGNIWQFGLVKWAHAFSSNLRTQLSSWCLSLKPMSGDCSSNKQLARSTSMSTGQKGHGKCAA